MEKNKSYWNKQMPYLDRIEFYHVLPFSPEMASAILANRVDYVFATDPATFRKATATAGMTTAPITRASFTRRGSTTRENHLTIRGFAARCIWSSTGRC